MRKFLAISVFVAIAGFIILPSPPVDALSGSDFQAGRIIDDSVFFSPNTMTPNDIQIFLNSKVPTCDTNGSKPYGGTTRAAYGASKGYPAPYTCLRHFTQDTPNRGAEAGLCSTYPGGSKSAAQIIFDVSQVCGINPKVLLILLEKEQSLITDDWPWAVQYRSATGYGCPDTAPCDAEYYGFFNQVYSAARQFKRYSKDATQFRYRAQRDNYIQYNPTASCGGTNVYVQNQATAGLYNYTPYQPNPSALANLYGTGDGCGAYGNRNFWRIFNDWFGSTHGVSYSAQYVDVQNYTDSSKSASVAANLLQPGQRTYMVLRFRNTGSSAWQNSGTGVVRLVTLNTSLSPFCDTSWISCDRPATMNEASVAPGGIATFGFWYKAPPLEKEQDKDFTTNFGLAADPISYMSGTTQIQSTRVIGPRYYQEYVDVQNYTDSSKSASVAANLLQPGQRTYMVLRFRNTGNIVWRNNGPGVIRLTTANTTNSPFCDTSWISCDRPATMNEASVAPGGIATFGFWYKAPLLEKEQDKDFTTNFSLASDPFSAMTGKSQVQSTRVIGPRYYQEYVDVQNYTDSSKSASVAANLLQPGQRTYMVLRFRNTGNIVWRNNGPGVIRLTTANTTNSPFCDTSWISCDRPATMNEGTVNPSGIATFEFWYKAPSVNSDTNYLTNFSLASDPFSAMTGKSQVQSTLVKKP